VLVTALRLVSSLQIGMSSSEDREVAFFCTVTIASDGFEVCSSKQFAAVGTNREEAETIVAGDVLRYLVGHFMSSEEYRQQIPNSEAAAEPSLTEEIHREVRQIAISDVRFNNRPWEEGGLAHATLEQQEETHLPRMSGFVELGIQAELHAALLRTLARIAQMRIVYEVRHANTAGSTDTWNLP